MQKIKPIKLILRSQLQVDRAVEILQTIPLEPLMEVTISKHKDKKSLAQLRTVHMWIKEVQTHYQETEGKFFRIDAMKEYFKGLFGVIDIVDTPAGQKEILKSFSDYTVEEMREFMDKMNHYCGSELRIFLTIPNIDS
jgi:hypothetical protein